jgi:hypothetical protein
MSTRAAKGVAVAIVAAALTTLDPEGRYVVGPVHDDRPATTADAQPSR